MDIKQAKKLKAGDRVKWVEGGNGCPLDFGTVKLDEHQYPFVLWDSPACGERTYLVDTPVLKHMEKA
jgi:hypothetical protein